jgi:hypothetical protein
VEQPTSPEGAVANLLNVPDPDERSKEGLDPENGTESSSGDSSDND